MKSIILLLVSIIIIIAPSAIPYYEYGMWPVSLVLMKIPGDTLLAMPAAKDLVKSNMAPLVMIYKGFWPLPTCPIMLDTSMIRPADDAFNRGKASLDMFIGL